ncbi:FAD/NAD(P)-binding protein [Aquidulcibacter sp.]|uniref:NAD(P)-binding protein n=1 Tax=Aquidulcibacter sp. TaxID=2052990 RepID=UPI0025B92D7E|nr:FAD/NAD(P)-binding protein [Aquidulcibacter sp.]MCA3696638.1 NAD(P)-binding protein [Aquidulcibacter sp.]
METDYLIVGAGAVGLAFADTLLDQTKAHITIVDRHGKPGGHWNDAYSFVSLHQPSAFYGVNSLPLGQDRIDETGINQGLYELASGPEVSGYFEKVMNQRLLASGRVSYFPMSNYLGDGRFVSLLSGKETEVHIRKKTVDASYFGTTVPSTHRPKFAIEEGVDFVPLNELPHLWKRSQGMPKHFVIVGAGKTGMDAACWLLASGADPDSISWIMPRDSWLLNRRKTQPGLDFFDETIAGQADMMEACAEAKDVDDLFDRLEACGVMLRIDPNVRPTVHRYATVSTGEVAQLARIKHVIRKGRVISISPTLVVLEGGQERFGENTLYIDCSATAVEDRPAVPVFQDGLIVPQMIRIPQPAFSAALAAYVEANYEDDTTKNGLCGSIPLPRTLDMYPRAVLGNMMNQLAWSQDPKLRDWIRESRLDGFGKVIASVDPNDHDKMAVLKKFRKFAMPAAANLTKLIPPS